MNYHTLLVATLMVLLISMSGASAQLSTLQKDDRIRVTCPAYFNERMEGTFIKTETERLLFKIQSYHFSIPLNEIEKLEAVRKKTRNTKKGALIGALSGGFGLGLVGAFSVSGDQDGWVNPSPGKAFIGGLGIGGLIGGGIGAFFGHRVYSYVWKEIEM